MANSRHYPDPAEHPGAKPFIQGIMDRPGDPLPRMIFADWLEGNGYDNAAKWQRHFADLGRYPHKHDPDEPIMDVGVDSSGHDVEIETYDRDREFPSGWYPAGWHAHPVVGHAALPHAFYTGLFNTKMPEGDTRNLYDNLIFHNMGTDPESVLLHGMHHVDYDKAIATHRANRGDGAESGSS